MIKSISVSMLGGLSVNVDGRAVVDGSSKINKPWQVFCYLVLNRSAPCPTARLISVLWPDENLSDPANVLKNTVFALRKEFKKISEKSESPILFENGGYMCNPAIRFTVDAEEFEKKSKAAALNKKNRLETLGQAVGMYRGALLPQMENELWVMPLSLYYHQLFSENVQGLCQGLQENGRYNELFAAATSANRIDPLEESFYVYMFRALLKLRMHRAIITAYHKTARIFAEELGASLGPEIQEIYAAASAEVDSIEQDIMIIKDELREVGGEGGQLNGPLYCTYDVFKYMYQMVARSTQRCGGSVVIVLMTLCCEKGQPQTAKAVSACMLQVKNAVLGGVLRKSDTVARYSKSQYIIMLSVDTENSAEKVVARIDGACRGFLHTAGMKMVFATTGITSN